MFILPFVIHIPYNFCAYFYMQHWLWHHGKHAYVSMTQFKAITPCEYAYLNMAHALDHVACFCLSN